MKEMKALNKNTALKSTQDNYCFPEEGVQVCHEQEMMGYQN